MDIRKVKKLIELLEESGIAEIEISEGEESVRISRYPTGQARADGPLRGALPRRRLHKRLHRRRRRRLSQPRLRRRRKRITP